MKKKQEFFQHFVKLEQTCLRCKLFKTLGQKHKKYAQKQIQTNKYLQTKQVKTRHPTVKFIRENCIDMLQCWKYVLQNLQNLQN